MGVQPGRQGWMGDDPCPCCQGCGETGDGEEIRLGGRDREYSVGAPGMRTRTRRTRTRTVRACDSQLTEASRAAQIAKTAESPRGDDRH